MRFHRTEKLHFSTQKFVQKQNFTKLQAARGTSVLDTQGIVKNVTSRFWENGGQNFWIRGTLAISPSCGACLQTLHIVPELWKVILQLCR